MRYNMDTLKIPFTFYDFFGYLFPGFIFAISICLLFTQSIEYEKIIVFLNDFEEYKYILVLIIAIISYSLGHVVSSLGSWLFEKILIGKWLNYPSDNLFKKNNKNGLFSSYRRNYTEEFREAFNKNFEEIFGDFKNYDKFMLCFTYIKEKCPNTFSRLNVFISLYDFSRNSAMSLLILAFVTILKGNLLFSLLLMLLTLLFFTRYLRFFRIYGDEVFRSFYVYTKKPK